MNLPTAIEAARAGAAVITDAARRGVTHERKGASELVSEADTGSERAIVEVIRRHYPDHSVLGEETHKDDAGAEHLWIIDPLDGTTNFAHGLDHVAISIAYCRGGRVECGVVHNPMRGDWFTAVRGGGAFHNDQPIRVGAQRRLDEVLVATGFYYDRGAMMHATLETIRALFGRSIHGIRRFGTASLDLCMTATGAFGAFFEYQLSPWDYAAGRLIVEEAGGRVSTCAGEPLPLAQSTSVLASNGSLHEEMLEVVRGCWAGRQ